MEESFGCNPSMKEFAILTAHEAFAKHSDNKKAAGHIHSEFNKKYG